MALLASLALRGALLERVAALDDEGLLRRHHPVVNPDKFRFPAARLSVPVTFVGAVQSKLVTSPIRRE